MHRRTHTGIIRRGVQIKDGYQTLGNGVLLFLSEFGVTGKNGINLVYWPGSRGTGDLRTA